MLRRAQQFQAMADPIRLRILYLLRTGAPSATELNQSLRMSQPRVAHHLKILVTSGLVTAVRDGRFVRYHPADQGFERSLFLLACESIAAGSVSTIRSTPGARRAPAGRERIEAQPSPETSDPEPAGDAGVREAPEAPDVEPPRKGGDLEDFLL